MLLWGYGKTGVAHYKRGSRPKRGQNPVPMRIELPPFQISRVPLESVRLAAKDILGDLVVSRHKVGNYMEREAVL